MDFCEWFHLREVNANRWQQMPAAVKGLIHQAAMAEKSGLTDKIVELAARAKTAKEIAKELGIDEITVKAVRLDRGIPSASNSMGRMGKGELSQEFLAWRDKHYPGMRQFAPPPPPPPRPKKKTIPIPMPPKYPVPPPIPGKA